MTQIQKKILFVSEAVTLAQVVRLRALAGSVCGEHEVHFAAARFDPAVFDGAPFARWPIWSISPQRAARRAHWGLPLHDRRTLERSLADDLRVIRAVRPDVIVSDLRWSLAVSGPLSGVKVISLANAYWRTSDFPLPEHPLVSLLGVERAAPGFRKALPFAFARAAAPLNALRRRHGLPEIGALPEVLCWGDAVLFADPPALFPGFSPRPHERFIGHVPWAPGVPFEAPAAGRPFVYVTMGSSGSVRALDVVLAALAPLDATILVATAGRAAPKLPANARAVPLVRGDLAARAASVVVCNGGASTAYQALAEGTPVVGLPSNLDQYLSMQAIERAGAGILLRSGTATPAQVRLAYERARHLRPPAALDAVDPFRTLRQVLSQF